MKILLFCKSIEGNNRLLEIAVEQAKAFNASVDIISCVSEKSEIPSEVTEEITEKVKNALQDYKEKIFKPAGIDCNTEVIVTIGSLGEEVVVYAENNDIDTIIMSVQKRSKVGKVFFGSTSQYVILEAPCKVLTVK